MLESRKFFSLVTFVLCSELVCVVYVFLHLQICYAIACLYVCTRIFSWNIVTKARVLLIYKTVNIQSIELIFCVQLLMWSSTSRIEHILIVVAISQSEYIFFSFFFVLKSQFHWFIWSKKFCSCKPSSCFFCLLYAVLN